MDIVVTVGKGMVLSTFILYQALLKNAILLHTEANVKYIMNSTVTVIYLLKGTQRRRKNAQKSQLKASQGS